MRAVQFSRFGGVDALEVVDRLPSPAADGTAIVRVMASSINPSDVKNVAGAMSQTTLPRVPGRDYAGRVEVGPPEWVGAEVWGSGGDVGFTRDGTHAELVAVPVASLRRKPAGLNFDQAASVGVNFITAWCGLVEAANLGPAETVAIIGSSGGVGSAAAQIAARIGARVIGIDRHEPHPDAPIRAVAERLIVGATDLPAVVREATDGEGAAVVFDLVGGPMFPTALACLALRGRLVEISSGGRPDVSFDLADFYHRELRLFGVDTLNRDLARSAVVLDQLAPSFDAGTFRPAPIAATFPLDDVRAAYGKVAEGTFGRIVLRPQE